MTYSFSTELAGRTSHNLNALIAVVGSPGSGKSYFALASGEATAAKNNVEFGVQHICFSLEEFNAMINSNLPKGSILILDEAAVTGNARTWYSLQNRLLNYIFITFRSSNLVTFLCGSATRLSFFGY